MSIHNFILQLAFLYAPLLHPAMVEKTANLYTGPDPKVKDIYVLHDKGFKTIISLRTNPELKKQRLCEKLGMRWIQIKTGVFQTPTDEQFDQFREIVNDKENQPCYASCEVASDRVGVYVAAYRMVDQGWSAQQMCAECRQNHQKTWWPIFRKYKRVVAAYAEKREAVSGLEGNPPSD